jgi:hypothetical protein
MTKKLGRMDFEDPNRAKLVEEARLWLLAMKVPQTPMHPITIINALESTWDKIEKKEADSKQFKKND